MSLFDKLTRTRIPLDLISLLCGLLVWIGALYEHMRIEDPIGTDPIWLLGWFWAALVTACSAAGLLFGILHIRKRDVRNSVAWVGLLLNGVFLIIGPGGMLLAIIIAFGHKFGSF